MSQSMPVKLSGELVDAARSSAKRFHRSLTGQIEHWAALGRVIESQLPGDALSQLMDQLGGTMKIGRVAEADQRQQIAAVLMKCLEQTSDDGAWLRKISTRGVPLYGSEPGQVGKTVRLNPDGTREAVKMAGTQEVLPKD